MDFASHPYREGFVLDRGDYTTDINVISSRPPRKFSLNHNFSYPRPDSQLRRHESSGSCSSLASNSSMPGMTDSSDSETSFDEDSNYNTTASEIIWDTFWPDSTIVPGEQYPVLLRASQTPNYFTKSFPHHDFPEVDDPITPTKLKQECKVISNSPCDIPTPQTSPPRSATRNQPSYSIIPKLEPVRMLRAPLPPRTSSLNTEALSPPRRQTPKSNRPYFNLRSSKSSHNLRAHRVTPAVPKVPVLPVSSPSVPASPAYPPPPPPRTLRPATSAINLREKQKPLNQTHRDGTVPRSPLSAVCPKQKPQPASRPNLERFVSVFEVDSDHESIRESSSFTKRIARGFHKKSASEKRIDNHRRGSSDSQSSEKENTNRKRGGSLGRILGFKGR